MRSYLRVISLITVIILSSFANPVSANDEKLVLGDSTPEIVFNYYSMFNTGYFLSDYEGTYSYIYPYYQDTPSYPYGWQRCLIPFDEDWPDYYWRHPGLSNDDGNSTFLYAKVESTYDPGYMMRQVEINSTDEYSLDFFFRYCGGTNTYDGEYTDSYIGLYPNSSLELRYDSGYQVVNSTSGNPKSDFTGIQVSCFNVGGNAYYRFYARTAESGLLGNVLVGPASLANSVSNTLYQISINRYNDSGTWKQSFYITNLDNDQHIFSDISTISGNQDFGWFAFWDNPNCEEIGGGNSKHILELKNMTSYGEHIEGQPSDHVLTGHTFRLGKLIFNDEPEIPETPVYNQTLPDIFPHIEPNESLALIIIGFGAVFILATIFMLRRR